MIIKDKDFGEVIVRRSPLARNIKFSISTSGRLAMSVPAGKSDRAVKWYLNLNREIIKKKLPLKDPREQRARDYQKKVLMKKAREYLPERLDQLARKYGYHYGKCRLSHAGTRWGSCSSNKTISLNIDLMKVPEVLRDYVILHELAHLNHMDHSREFWAEVEMHDKDYKKHQKMLKQYTLGI